MEKTSEWLLSFNSKEKQYLENLIHERSFKYLKLSNNKKCSSKSVPSIVTSITGGKGGVGKTSISLKFARTLAHAGYRTLLIDCDYNLSNTAIKLNLALNNSNFYDLLTAKKSFDECLYKEKKFHLLSACNGDLDLFESKLKLEELIIDIINTHQSDYDYIFLDCPAGINRESVILNAYSDYRVFVVTPDRSSITDSYSLMKVLSKKYHVKENHLLVNMVTNRSQFKSVASSLSETAENFLGLRTSILGGLRKIDIEFSRFDDYFLNQAENSHHKNFLKLLNRYVDSSNKFFDRMYKDQNVKQVEREHEVLHQLS